MPLAGVEVCQLDTDNCGVTDGTNPLFLQMPANEEIRYTLVNDGYDRELRSDVMEAETAVFPTMNTTAFAQENYEGIGSPYPPQGTGSIFLSIWSGLAGGTIPGATVELIDGTGKVFYLDDDGFMSTDLTSTASERSVGSFVEVPPGEVQVKVAGTAVDCEVVRGWPGDEANTVRMLVREGFRILPRVLCTDAN